MKTLSYSRASLPRNQAVTPTLDLGNVAEVERYCSPAPVAQEDEIQGDSPARSLVKAITWRAVALAVTMGVTWTVTGSTTFALTIGAFNTVIKIGAYYAHERLWLKIPFGR